MNNRPVIAAVIAGGRWKGETPAGMTEWRALSPVAGRPMVAYILDALAAAKTIHDTILVGPPELSEAFPSIHRLDPTPTLTGNVLAVSQYAAGKGRILLVGSDIPLLTPQSVDNFIHACSSTDAKLYYPVIPKDVVLSRYPDMRRTFLKLRDGVYTGGNLILADPQFLLDSGPKVQALYNARKSPFGIARILGPQLLIRMVLTAAAGIPLLDIPLAARLVGRALGAPVAGITVNDPEIGADLDSIDELPAFERALQQIECVGHEA